STRTESLNHQGMAVLWSLALTMLSAWLDRAPGLAKATQVLRAVSWRRRGRGGAYESAILRFIARCRGNCNVAVAAGNGHGSRIGPQADPGRRPDPRGIADPRVRTRSSGSRVPGRERRA